MRKYSKMKISLGSLLLFIVLLPINLDASGFELQEWPSFEKEMGLFCEANPYDCINDAIVSAYKLNSFLRSFYFGIEKRFADSGFEKAIFEFCQGNRLRGGHCLTEGIDVKNSNNPLSTTFPKRDKYFQAFGGVNKNLGVHFKSKLRNGVANNLCSTVIRPGNELSKRAEKALASGAIESIEGLQSRFYKNYRIELVQYLPTIWGVNSATKLPEAECWLIKKERKIVFEIFKEAS
ncbi:hypothetical protein OAR36_13150 [Pseudomonadales bacterium]|nr:hypothetical protein [Pseudomonadales bacterium]